ncbi:RDD family protein [Brachybacterium sp. NBEC-018]|uniref:RDD family protein n=1 Tax=Brachybacterium sp. NBEC-018 TaxID=2996004 RepID=UPI0021754CCD|nr:RDD family protein [Brachybacterium sp. NBEC-018]UVY82357.1 RDD family protein [Brachybacterium sp. NBEC-018]
MNQTRYCSTCGALLPEGAAVCGECGARYQASPYERRATDAPDAWSQSPRARSRDLGQEESGPAEEEGIQLLSREDLAPREPGATTLRGADQYDRRMVTQPGTQPGGDPGASPVYGSPAPAPASATPGEGGPAALEPPLDGCVPAPAAKRLLAAIVDGVIHGVVLVPLIIGIVLIATQESPGTLAAVLTGIGVALPVAYAVVIIWLHGAKGFTPGKLALGLRTARVTEGGRLGFVRSLGRAVLYRLFPLLFALSIFLDPRGTLRGFHDRVVDSVVVDVKAGRDPLRPRADDFERRSDEEYLGAPSVAVDAHDNLLAAPGAAWSGGVPSAPSAQPAGAPAPADAPWSPPSSPAAPAPEAAPSSGPSAAPAEQWGPPAPAASAPVDQPPVSSASSGAGHESWAPSAPSAPAQPEQPAPSWGPPPSAEQPAAPAEPVQPAPPVQPSQPVQPPQPAQPFSSAPPAPPAAGYAPPPQESFAPAPVPEQSGDITGDAWAAQPAADGPAEAEPAVGADEVDEQTRMTAPVGEDLGDLEATRISAVSLPPVHRALLTVDDGTEHRLDRTTVLGRNPSAEEGEAGVVLPDPTRSISKTHLRVEPTAEGVTVTDLGSTNGSAILLQDGTREALVPHTATEVPAGARVGIGDRWLTVEREQ